MRIPPKLEKLLINIFSSKGKTTNRLSRLEQSIGQELIYHTTRGTNRQLKHVQLGKNVKQVWIANYSKIFVILPTCVECMKT